MVKKSFKRENIIIIFIVIFIILFLCEIYFYLNQDDTTYSINMNKNNNSSNKTLESEGEFEEAQIRTIQNVLSSSGQVETALDEKLTLHTSYYFDELLVEENKLISEGENILSYTNGTYLTAPYDCVLVSSSLPDENDICTTSHYIEIQSLYSLSMSLNISESDINKVKIGDNVKITLTSTNESVAGKITSISEVGTYSSLGSYFSSTVTFINNGNIKIGMSAKCEIIIETAENVLTVPVESIQKSDKGEYVIVQNDDGTTENVHVETGIESDDYVEIKSGITENTKVLVSTSSSNESTNNFFQGENRQNNREEMRMPGDMMNSEGSSTFPPNIK